MESTKLPARQPRNKIVVYLDNFLLPPLRDAGSSISVLSLALFRRLNKVLLPPSGLLLRSALNTINTPLATAKTRLFINNICCPLSFVLFPNVPMMSYGAVTF